MTTLSTPSDNASPVEFVPSSLEHDFKNYRVYGTDGSERFITRSLPTGLASDGGCKIYFFESSPGSSQPSKSFSDFDDLLKSVEANPVEAAAVGEARKWVAETFYGNHITLTSLRLAAGLSQRQVAAACGIEQPHVSRYESGRHEPSLGTAQRMAAVLGVDLDAFAIAWTNTAEQASAKETK